MPMLLIPVNGGDPIVLEKAITLVGRHPDCDAVLVSSRKVSRKHCLLAQVNQDYVVRDLGSMNGVRVNGEAARDDTLVKEGDDLQIGDVNFKLKVGPKPEKPVQKPVAAARPVMPGRNVKVAASKSVKPISRDVPVAIPDEEASFIVEETRMPRPKQKPSTPKPAHLSDDVIVLSDEDIVSD